jgi:hypothetical protein
MDEAKLPTQSSSPASEHGQMMFAMGKIFGRLDALDQKQAYARGDDRQSRELLDDFGRIYHPEVSTECANDLLKWSLKWILTGHIEQCSTWKFQRSWYTGAPDCGV